MFDAHNLNLLNVLILLVVGYIGFLMRDTRNIARESQATVNDVLKKVNDFGADLARLDERSQTNKDNIRSIRGASR